MVFSCFWPSFIVISSYINIHFIEPVYHVPNAFHIFVLPKFPRGSDYSYVVDRYVYYVRYECWRCYIIFYKFNWFEFIYPYPSHWSGGKFNLSLFGLFYHSFPWDNTKVLPKKEALEKTLWYPVHADHSSFAYCSSLPGFLKESLLRLDVKVIRVPPSCETIQPCLLLYHILLGILPA